MRLFVKNRANCNKGRGFHLPLLLLVFNCFNIEAQFNYINTIHSGLGVQPGVGATYHQGKIYTASLTADIRYYNVARFDSTGVLEQEFTFFTDSVSVFHNCAKCVNVNENRLYQVSIPFSVSGGPYLLIYKFDLNLDTIRQVDTLHVPNVPLGNDSTAGISAWGSKFDSDSTFLITGLVYSQPTPVSQFRYDLFLARMDTSLNLLWINVVTDNNPLRDFGLYGENIMVDDYGGIVVTGNPYYWAFVQTGFAARFRASDGQLLWKHEYTPDLGFAISNMFVVDNQDGTYQYAMNEWTSSTGTVCLVKHGEMDTLGNILNSNYIGNRDNPPGGGVRSNFAQDLIRTKDGNYYVAGIGFFGNKFGYGAKFNRSGDSLWYREYTHGGWNPLGPPLEEGWIEWFTQKPDSSFLHVGWNRNSPTGVLNTWILNTDKYGCDSLGCQSIGLQEEFEKDQWQLYPIPAKEYVFIESNSSLQSIRKVELLNTLGQKIQELGFDMATQNKIRIHLKDTTPGVYLLRIVAPEGMGIERLIIE